MMGDILDEDWPVRNGHWCDKELEAGWERDNEIVNHERFMRLFFWEVATV